MVAFLLCINFFLGWELMPIYFNELLNRDLIGDKMLYHIRSSCSLSLSSLPYGTLAVQQDNLDFSIKRIIRANHVVNNAQTLE